MSKNDPHILGKESIGKLLLQYSIPAIIGMTITSIYNIIDSIFIGHGVGAMAIVGSLQDALDHDPSTLFTKAILDFMIIMVFSSTYGRGAIFSALPVGVLQGSVTLFAGLLAPLLSGTVIDSLSFIGSLLIFCVGVNLAFGDRFRVANMLPALIFGGIWASLMG